MKDVNKMILLGRLGAQPVQRLTKTGIPVTHFSVATTRRWSKTVTSPHSESTGLSPSVDSNAVTEETQWHQVVAWGKQALHCAQYLRKGSRVYIEGSIRSHTYSDKQGQQKLSFEIHLENVSFLNQRETLVPSEREENTPETHLDVHEMNEEVFSLPLLSELEASRHHQS